MRTEHGLISQGAIVRHTISQREFDPSLPFICTTQQKKNRIISKGYNERRFRGKN